MIYKIMKTANGDCVLFVDTATSIPINPDNTDYQAYLKWLEEGNTPLPADEVTA
jgi:hypothetical protein